MIQKKGIILGVASIVVAAVALAPSAYAALTANSQLTQEITGGALSTDIRDASGAIVTNPAFALSSVTASSSQQTSTGVFGDNARRITVDNPGGANGGWVLSLNATTPGTGTWTSGANTYAYNGTAATGQLTVNPAAGALTATIGGTTGVTLGSSASFSGTGSITLLTGAAASADMWNGYITGVGLSQTIPAGQSVGNYTLDMTQTVVAS